MTATHDPDALSITHTAGRATARFEGRVFTFGGTDYQSPETLRAAALRHQEAAARSARSARFALAVARYMEAEAAEAKAQAAAQRRARAAATRARRADPFGFNAAAERRAQEAL